MHEGRWGGHLPPAAAASRARSSLRADLAPRAKQGDPHGAVRSRQRLPRAPTEREQPGGSGGSSVASGAACFSLTSSPPLAVQARGAARRRVWLRAPSDAPRRAPPAPPRLRAPLSVRLHSGVAPRHRRAPPSLPSPRPAARSRLVARGAHARRPARALPCAAGSWSAAGHGGAAGSSRCRLCLETRTPDRALALLPGPRRRSSAARQRMHNDGGSSWCVFFSWLGLLSSNVSFSGFCKPADRLTLPP